MKKLCFFFMILLMSVFLILGQSADAGQKKSAVSSKKDAVEKFIMAEIAYKEQRYEDAVKLYESIIAGGFESGPIYYNLGNSYFKRKDYAKTLLNYEKALRLMPRDDDLNTNYLYTRSLSGIPATQEKHNFIQKLIAEHNQFYTLDEMVIILFILFISVGSLYIIGKFLNWPRQRIWMVELLLVLLFSIYLTSFLTKYRSENHLAVILDETDSTFEPRAGSQSYFELLPGQTVKVIKEQGKWVKIQRSDGKMGWVPKETVEMI